MCIQGVGGGVGVPVGLGCTVDVGSSVVGLVGRSCFALEGSLQENEFLEHNWDGGYEELRYLLPPSGDQVLNHVHLFLNSNSILP